MSRPSHTVRTPSLLTRSLLRDTRGDQKVHANAGQLVDSADRTTAIDDCAREHIKTWHVLAFSLEAGSSIRDESRPEATCVDDDWAAALQCWPRSQAGSSPRASRSFGSTVRQRQSASCNTHPRMRDRPVHPRLHLP